MIYGKSDERRYPVIGKIKIGIKGISSGGKEIPKSIDYFRATGPYAEMFNTVYGEKPRNIEIVFPPIPQGGDIDSILNHYYRMYKGGGVGKNGRLFCIGNGKTAMRSDGKGNMHEGQKCPCEYLETGQCKERLRLTFMIPAVPVIGVWVLETSSVNSRINVVSGIDITKVFAGSVCGIPMNMSVEIQEGAVFGSNKKYPVIKILPNATTEQLLQIQGKDAGEVFQLLTDRGSKSTIAIAHDPDKTEKFEGANVNNVVIDADDLPKETIDKAKHEELEKMKAKREQSDTPFNQTPEEKELQKELDAQIEGTEPDKMERGIVIEAIRREFDRLGMVESYIKNSMRKYLTTTLFSEAKDLDLQGYLQLLREKK